jgi:hypothetical protein
MSLRSALNRLLLGGVTLALCGGALAYAMNAQDAVYGHALYVGEHELNGQLPDEAAPLPRDVARCINCHEGADDVAPALNARHLLQPQARRGGPPTRFDETRFCQLLREGVDPAGRELARDMPRYALAPGDCRALWTYLTGQ